MLRCLIAVFALAILGCAAVPTSGTYVLTTTASESDCETSGDTGGSDEATLDIRVAEDGSNFQTGDVTCELDGPAFDCTLSQSRTDYADSVPDADAVFTTLSTIAGKWTSNKKIVGTTEYDLKCTGDDCETYGAPTCGGSTEFEAELRE